MKVGSIVECVNNKNPNQGTWSGCVVPKLKQPYTVRTVSESQTTPGQMIIRVEEIVNPINEWAGSEFGYRIERFRELLPPMEIQSALDSCEPVLIEITSTPLSK